MKILRRQSTATLILALSIVVALLAYLPVAIAQTEKSTFSYLSVTPDPVGVGQSLDIAMWSNLMAPYYTRPNPAGGGSIYIYDAYWKFTVTVTKPDGTTQTIGTYTSDPVGSAYAKYTPDTVGKYTFQMTAAGILVNRTNIYYKPSTSPQVTVTVQEEQIVPMEGVPLPTEYWTRPIYGENREWASLSGYWLMDGYNNGLGGFNQAGAFNPYTTAPNTAHIMWTKPFRIGGTVGGDFGELTYYLGMSYERWFTSPIIINGRLYYNIPIGNIPVGGGFVCVDLRTGEQLWWANGTVQVGQLFDFESMNQHGVTPYLWDLGQRPSGTATSWEYVMYDAMTGQQIITIPNTYRLAAGPVSKDEIGSVIIYFLNGANNWLAKWNSTLCIEKGIQAAGTGFGFGDKDYWRPHPSTKYNWADGIQWNVTVPDVPGVQSFASWPHSTNVDEDRILAVSGLDNTNVITNVNEVMYSTQTGAQLWQKNQILDPEDNTWARYGWMRDGVYTVWSKPTMTWRAYDVNNGNLLWTSDPRPSAWGMYLQGATNIAYGKFYAAHYDGHVIAYDLTTGKTIWDYYVGSSGFETTYGTWPLYQSLTIADGKVFAVTGEHSPNSPLWRGEKLHVMDAETGKAIWNVSGWFSAGNPAIVDGYYVGLNGFDNQLYCFGKGPSATTVEAPMNAVEFGSSVVVRGTVTDIAAGTMQDALAARFPHGVPVVADKDMTRWMSYLYQQKTMPTDAEGVDVWIDVLDANGNYRNIGKVTTDLSGFYRFTWQPDIPGDFKVVATFAGSESYWPSYSETAFTVSEPPTPPAAEPEPAPSMADLYFLPLSISMIVAIIIVAVLLAMLLTRKRS